MRMFLSSVVGVAIVRIEDIEDVSLIFYALLFLCISIVLIIIHIKTWFFARRRILKQVITAEYDAPLDLNPAEISYLFRRQLDSRDFAALLVHMSHEGVIHFRKQDGKRVVFAGPKYRGKLKSYEKLILDTLDDNKPVTAEDLVNHHKTIFKLGKINNSLTEHVKYDLRRNGYIRKKPISRRSIALLRSIILLLVSLIWIPLIAIWFYTALSVGSNDPSSFGDVVISGLVLSAVLFIPALAAVVFIKFLQSRSTGRAWIIEHKLLNFWPQIIGFRQYVYLSEVDKLTFSSKELKKKSNVHTLPYAIAFGFVKNWREIVT